MERAPAWYQWKNGILELRIHVRARSRREGLAAPGGDSLEVRVNAPAVEGKANKRMVALLAQAFGVAPTRVHLVRGMRSRQKLVRIERPGRVPEPLESELGTPGRVDQTRKGV